MSAQKPFSKSLCFEVLIIQVMWNSSFHKGLKLSFFVFDEDTDSNLQLTAEPLGKCQSTTEIPVHDKD